MLSFHALCALRQPDAFHQLTTAAHHLEHLRTILEALANVSNGTVRFQRDFKSLGL